MNCRNASILILAFATASGVSRGAAVASFELETRVYVYKSSDFHTVEVPRKSADPGARGAVFTAPATARFDQATLSLEGSSFSWSGGGNPPARFSLVATPTLPLQAGTAVTLSSTTPVQYLEKLPDGTLGVREILRNSPEAPHCRLTFSVSPPAAPADALQLACDFDIAMVNGREGVAGVALEVGKPLLSRLAATVQPVVRIGQWSALLCEAPNASDYSMLVLLKITPGPGAGAVAAAKREGMTAAELDAFAMHYYLHPEPALISAAIEAFGPSGFAQDRPQVFVGFFAEVFALNPDRVAAWGAVVERQIGPAKDYLRVALELGRPGAVLSAAGQQAGFDGGGLVPLVRDAIRGLRRDADPSLFRPVLLNDRYWGAFFASGDPAYLRALVNELKFVDERSTYETLVTGVTAMWSLARNAPEHPAVRSTLEAMRPQADPGTRDRIDEILTEKPEVIREKLVALENAARTSPRSFTPFGDLDNPGNGKATEYQSGPANASDRAFIDSMTHR